MKKQQDKLHGKGGYLFLILFFIGGIIAYIGYLIDDSNEWNLAKTLGILGIFFAVVSLPILVYHLKNLKVEGNCKCSCHTKNNANFKIPSDCGWCGHVHG
ncbi:MAG TPA: hypothetical protein VLE02_05215 [Nitrosarchaeum sp.]|nr:hypothetical protein [Nitrosarchaeum sp.]